MQKSQEILLDIKLPEPTYERTTYQLKTLSKELLVLRLAFGQMKKAISDAFAPIGAVVIPMITGAIRWVTQLANTLGGVISNLLGVKVAQEKVEKTVVSTGKAVRRTLASFDKLNRLQDTSGGVKTTTQTISATPKISKEAAEIAAKIRELLAPLTQLDLSNLRWEFERLKDAVRYFAEDCGPVLQDLWNQVLVPFVAWLIADFAPVFLKTVAEAVRLVHATVLALTDGFLDFRSKAQPVLVFMGETAKTVFSEMGQLFVRLRDAVCDGSIPIREIFYKMGIDLQTLWGQAAPTLDEMRTGFHEAFRSIDDVVINACNALLSTLRTTMQTLAAVVAEGFNGIWDVVANVCKGGINGVIGFLNLMLEGFAEAVNGVGKLLNKLKVTVPDWVPDFGGKTFGFNLKAVTAPSIPQLAKGAVLPANQPFLAVVGDQKHGTNIEAPLATIQEAVALTMEDLAQSNLAGHQATAAVLERILSAVLGIKIGDVVIGQAAQRYNERLSVMRGSAY